MERVCGPVGSVTAAAMDGWSDGAAVEILPFAHKLTLELILQSLVGAADPGTRDELFRIFGSMVSLPGSAVAGYFPHRFTLDPTAARPGPVVRRGIALVPANRARVRVHAAPAGV